jgi:DNA ligase-1
MFQEVKLYRKNSLGIGTWRVWGTAEGVSFGTVHIAHATVEGGSEVGHTDPVVTNASGRRIEEQLKLEINSRISRQLDKGYKHSRDEAILGSTNQLGLVNPMLAQPLDKVTIKQHMFGDAYVQNKFDGHRCLITRQGGELIAYTRKGKPITTIPHILEDCFNWMQDGDTLDGELYIHGVALQAISSLIKREQGESRRLCYHWYDLADRTRVFGDRYRMMKDLYANVRTPQIVLVPTTKVERMAEVYEHFKKARDEGYEGSMLRVSTHGYQDAKRSDQLIKIKERHDCEVTVLGARSSSQGWAILRVKTDWGVQMDISAPGSVAQKTEVLQNIASYIGKRLTIEYAMLTADKVPFHAVATRWHEEL